MENSPLLRMLYRPYDGNHQFDCSPRSHRFSIEFSQLLAKVSAVHPFHAQIRLALPVSRLMDFHDVIVAQGCHCHPFDTEALQIRWTQIMLEADHLQRHEAL